MTRSRRAALAFVVAAAAAAGCGSKEDATLFVYTENPTLAKGDGPFGPGTVLTGGVDVVLDEGAYSQGSVSVQGVALRLFRGNLQILGAAKFESSPPATFPVVVSSGEKKTIHFTISIEQMSPQDQADLCAGPVTISGFVTQTSNPSQQTRVDATPITPTGC